MGKYIKEVNGSFRGKIGSVIGSKWKGFANSFAKMPTEVCGVVVACTHSQSY